MHAAALNLMARCLYRMPQPDNALVLDVGSYDVNGTLRPLVETFGARYIGLDVRPGPNVDVVAVHPYNYPLEADQFDAVICAGMLHNVPEPWTLIPEMVRILKPGGLLAITTVWRLGKNPHPADYWRFMPDGLRHLFDLTEDLEDYDIDFGNDQDVLGSAFKKQVWRDKGEG